MAGERYDLWIRGATVYDGSGGEPFEADVALRGDRVAAVGERPVRAGAELDARGLALAPGFIDVHSHDDFAVILEPEMDFKVMQGVTTDVVGNCGFGAAPFGPGVMMAQAFHPGASFEPWEGYAGYFEALERAAPSLNVAVLVGHGSVRAGCVADQKRGPDARELARMRDAVREGLEAGAVGYSTGLIYEPGRNASSQELIELARELAAAGGLYATHMRDEGRGLVDSVLETLRIGASVEVPVQISHHKASGRDAWGLVSESIKRIDAARAGGADVTADQYPYTAGSTMLAAVLQNAFEDREGGGLGRMRGSDVVVSSAPGHPDYEGRSLSDLARRFGLDAEGAGRRVLEQAPAAIAVIHSMCEQDVQTVLAHPATMIGSDGIPSPGKPHPRLYGTFPRVLGRYARDQGVLSLADAVRRMTGLAADKFRLAGRGYIREGAFADLVLFDPGAVTDTATFDDPRRYPAGLPHVFVNGNAVVRDGAHTGARPGRPLRRS